MVPVVVLQLAPILHIAEASVAVVAAQVLAQTIQIASARRLSLATGHGNPQKDRTGESYWTLVKEWIKMDKELLIAFPSFFWDYYVGVEKCKGGQPVNTCLLQFLLHICGSKKQSSISPTTLLLCGRTHRHILTAYFVSTRFNLLTSNNTLQRNHTPFPLWVKD